MINCGCIMALHHRVMMWFCKQPHSSREALLWSVGCVMWVLSASYTHLTLGLPRRDLLSPPPVSPTRRAQDLANLVVWRHRPLKGNLRYWECLVTESLIVQREEFSKKEKKLVQLDTSGRRNQLAYYWQERNYFLQPKIQRQSGKHKKSTYTTNKISLMRRKTNKNTIKTQGKNKRNVLTS